MKKYLYLLTVIVTFSACHRNDFTVTGNVSDAEGKTLYFEAVQLTRTVLLDSTQLPADGAFSFHAPRTESSHSMPRKPNSPNFTDYASAVHISTLP